MEKNDEKRPLEKKNVKSKRSRDWLVNVSAAQLVLACAGIALLLLSGRFFPNTFNQLKAEFNRIMQNDMSVSQLAQAVRSAVLYQQQETEQANLTTEASGGEDIEIYKATQTVCFAPIDATAEICVPVSGRITSHFGCRTHPITGVFGVHNGTDIAAPEGTPIYAAFNATVAETGYTSARGNYIVLAHGGDTQTIYLHCSEIVAPEGAVVRAGEVIARVGSTGDSTGPHLHFSIKINGRYCNPEWLLNDL